MALNITRREGEALLLTVDPSIDPAELVRQLQGGIRIDVTWTKPRQVGLAISAPLSVHVARAEIPGAATFKPYRKNHAKAALRWLQRLYR